MPPLTDLGILHSMNRTEAEKLFGGKPELAAAVGVSLPSIYDWPEKLPDRLADRVIAALIRADRVSEALKLSGKRS